MLRFRHMNIAESFFLFIGIGILFPAILWASSVTVSWNANTEVDLAGYKIYYGIKPGVYSVILDVGNVTSYPVPNLTAGITYYFVLTAYDLSGNESGYSLEMSFQVEDTDPPSVSSVVCQAVDGVLVVYNEKVEPISAQLAANYSINNGMVVQSAVLQSDSQSVYLHTTQHINGTYTLTINNVRDRADVPNMIAGNTQAVYTWNGNDVTSPTVVSIEAYRNDFIAIGFSEPLDKSSAVNIANYAISPAVAILSSALDGSFKKVYLSTAPHTAGLTYTLTINNVKDGASPANLIVPNTRINYSFQAEDSDPPDLIAARLNSAWELDLEFGENLDQTSAETVSNYSITPSVTVTNAAMTSNRHVILTTAAHSVGTYTITVVGVGDDADPPNCMTMATLSYSYTPPDLTAPVLTAVELTSDDLLQITFSEPIAQSGAENIGNYAISPSVTIQQASLNISGCIVRLDTDPHAAGTYRVTVNNILDRADPSNIISPNSGMNYTFDLPDVLPPVLLTAELHGSDVVELVFNEPLDRTSSENISHYQISPSVQIIQASLVSDSLNKIFLSTGAHQPGQSYTVTVQGIMDRAIVPNTIVTAIQKTYDYLAVDNTAPRLIVVTLEGDRFLEASFSEPLDKTTAEIPSNYLISPSIAVNEAILDASLQKVFIKTGIHQAGTVYTLTVQGVRDRANPPNIIGAENHQLYTCVSQDQVAPLLERAEILASQIVELSFSEPVEAVSALKLTNYTINNGISVLGATLSQSQMEVFLETTPHQKGTYTVSVSNVKDMAAISNTILPNSFKSYTYVPTDTVAPVLLSVVLMNPTMVEITFNEPLNRSSVENTAHYTISNAISVERAILDVTMSKIILQTGEHAPGSYTILLNSIQDASPGANTIAANTVSDYAYITVDNTPPYLVSSVLKSQSLLTVNFSEKLNPVSAENAANFAINNNIMISNVVLVSSADQIILETSNHPAGDYVLTVNGIYDASSSQNKIAPYSQIQYSWIPEDITGPALVSATVHTDTYLEIVFSEPVNSEDAKKTGNYSIDPFIPIQSAVLDASLDRVWLFTGAHSAGTYTVHAMNIRDRAFVPNTMSAQNTAQYHYIPPDLTAPGLLSVQVRTPMSVALIFDESLARASAEDITHYTIEPNIDVIEASLLANLTEVRLETSSHQAGINYQVTVQNIKDRAPIPNTITQPITQEYIYTPPDTTPPQLYSVKLQGTNLLELIFSEPLDQVSAEKRDNYHITPSIEVFNAFLDASTLMKVYLETSDHKPGIVYGINVRNVKDRAPIPNVISSATWATYSMPNSGASSDVTPPKVARVDVVSPISINLVFSEPMEKSSAETYNNYIFSDGITLQSAKLDTDLVHVHLTTSVHQAGQSYTIRVSNLRDLASTPNVLASDNPIKYLFAGSASMSDLHPLEYDWNSCHVNDTSYVDRDYTLLQIPECLDGSIQINTANDDKLGTESKFITFEMRGDATLYVAYDRHIETIPNWLSQWKPTGEQIVDSRSNVFHVYSREIKSGRIEMGGNCGTLDDNMYLAFVVPHEASGSVVADLNKASYEVEHLSVGDAYYIDRDYTLSSIPESLEGLLWIKTANDDKADRNEEFLVFTLNQPSTVYIAYDENIATLPCWLINAWARSNLQITDSRGTRFDVWIQDMETGTVVLGGNCGSMDDNMYTVMIKPSGDGGSGNQAEIPGYFTLEQNFPNPFNPSTTIRYKAHKDGTIKLTVFNILGQRVKVLLEKDVPAGFSDEVIWDGTDEFGDSVASGVYFYRIEQKQFAKARRMLLMR